MYVEVRTEEDVTVESGVVLAKEEEVVVEEIGLLLEVAVAEVPLPVVVVVVTSVLPVFGKA